jgi:SAM-dependent methyltransferase
MNNVYEFYKKKGWNFKKKISLDSELFEDNRKVAYKYLKDTRLKILKFIPKKGEHFLDFASGPIQYNEYLQYSKKYKLRHCVDFSPAAIREAKKKLKKHGRYYCKDILKIKFKKNYFDCILSMHTIYHINKNSQKKVINRLIEISKKNKPIIIVYSNPNIILKKIYSKFFNTSKKKTNIYFYCYPNEWWMQFEKKAQVSFHFWRSLSAQHQKKLIPNNFFGELLLQLLYFIENKFPKFFIKYFQYPIIILKKK